MIDSHAKGYRAEAAVEAMLRNLGYEDCYRPRAGRHEDVGDICGLPVVISVKDHARPALGAWCDELSQMVNRTRFAAGVVWHKRAGRADPLNWFVTMPGRLYVPTLMNWCEGVRDGRL